MCVRVYTREFLGTYHFYNQLWQHCYTKCSLAQFPRVFRTVNINMPKVSSKEKRARLSVATKLEIIEKLEKQPRVNAASGASLCWQCFLPPRTGCTSLSRVYFSLYSSVFSANFSDITMPPKRTVPSKPSGSKAKRQKKVMSLQEKVALLDLLRDG